MSAPRIETRACSICAAPFAARRAPNGRWTRTCGPLCQAEALDRLIAALTRRRDELLALAEDEP